MKTITYKDSGVDIQKADTLIDNLKKRIQDTFNPFVLNPIGGFGSMTEIPSGYKRPILVTSTDGVGTKLKIAFLSGKHDTVGIDLVAMSANDVLTLGAKPYFFLDYFASGKIEEAIYNDVIKGICDGCMEAGCALIGGESAEMPSFYKDGEYDLAGFAIGFVEKDDVVDGSKVKEGNAIIGLASNGLHSNGYSLVRKVILDVHNLNIFEEAEGVPGKLYEELLRPTRIYVKPVTTLLETVPVNGMVHITGSGLPGNTKRVIPDGLSAVIDLSSHRVPPIFHLIMRLGNIPLEEMYSTFNMGIGFVIVVDKDHEDEAMDILASSGESPFKLGRIEDSKGKEKVNLLS